MRAPATTFRFSKETIKQIDRLVTNPPAIAIDSDLGKPRNRTELLENLVRKAFAQIADSKEASKKSA